jgi:flagellar basal-body rod protein FlgG
MITALKSAASGMEAQMAQINSISNNLANVNTTGYKKERAEFQDLLYETLQEPGAQTSAQTQAPVGIQRGMGVKVSGTQRSFEMGSPVHTNRDLDMMIRGDGFFVIGMPNGETGYSRDGSFFKSSTGRIETIDGYPLQPEIIVPPNAKKVEIADNGTVYSIISESERTQIGQIQLATFINNSGLKAHGKNLYLATDASGQPNVGTPNTGTTGAIMASYLESSNVDVVHEMTDMITAQRAFEMNSKVIQTVDQLLQNTNTVIR